MNIKKLALILLIFIAAFIVYDKAINNTSTIAPSTQVTAKEGYFSYKGQTGKDALLLLKEKAKIEQDNSGLVVSINGRKTSSSAREYWAFYVNGKLASVGPADYKTTDADTIEWKIEKY